MGTAVLTLRFHHTTLKNPEPTCQNRGLLKIEIDAFQVRIVKSRAICPILVEEDGNGNFCLIQVGPRLNFNLSSRLLWFWMRKCFVYVREKKYC